MKKYLLILVLTAIVVPSVAFASWWNPLSWFSPKATETLNAPESEKKIEPTDVNKEDATTTDTNINKIAELNSIIIELKKEIAQLKNQTPQIKETIKEVPVEKIVYRDHIVYRDNPTNCNNTTQTSQTTVPAENPYSDYNFSYTTSAVGPNALNISFPQTSRQLRLTKAVFKISDEYALKFDTMGWQITFGFYYNGKIQPYSLERTDKNTFSYISNNQSGIYVGQIPYLQIIVSGETNTIGENIKIPITEWQIWDSTTGKPVKIQ